MYPLKKLIMSKFEVQLCTRNSECANTTVVTPEPIWGAYCDPLLCASQGIAAPLTGHDLGIFRTWMWPSEALLRREVETNSSVSDRGEAAWGLYKMLKSDGGTGGIPQLEASLGLTMETQML